MGKPEASFNFQVHSGLHSHNPLSNERIFFFTISCFLTSGKSRGIRRDSNPWSLSLSRRLGECRKRWTTEPHRISPYLFSLGSLTLIFEYTLSPHITIIYNLLYRVTLFT